MIGMPTPYTPPSPSSSETCTGAAFAVGELLVDDGDTGAADVDPDVVAADPWPDVLEVQADTARAAASRIAITGSVGRRSRGGIRRIGPSCLTADK
jgi:hypothetical protein